MIARALHYVGPNAVVRTRLGDLLRSSDYEMLLNAAELPEFLEAMRTTPYAPALQVPGKSFAFALQYHWLGRTESAANFQPFRARDLCNAYLAKMENEAVKTVVRGIARNTERRRLLSMLPPVPESSSIPFAAVTATDKLEAAAKVLRGTTYGDAIEEGIRVARTGDGDELWPIEAALDRRYFIRLEAAGRRFAGAEGVVVTRLLGAVADAFNVLAAERLNRTFHLSPQAVNRQLVPWGLRVGANEWRALCKWPGEGLPPIRFRRDLAEGRLRVALLRMLCREAMKPLFTVPFHAGLTFAYVLLSELEVDDLLRIYEGKQWGAERSIVAAGLIRFHGPGLSGGVSSV